jgi:hypothetical protein
MTIVDAVKTPKYGCTGKLAKGKIKVKGKRETAFPVFIIKTQQRKAKKTSRIS